MAIERREVTIASLGARGDGMAVIDGRPVHVPLALAGERVRIVLDGPDARLDARLDAVLAPSPDRVAPACRHFGDCGGCQIQHLASAAAADWKRGLVRHALEQRGLGDVEVLPTLSLPPGERRRARFAVERKGRAVRLGFHARRSHRLVDLEECPVSDPALAALIAPLRRLAAVLPFEAATVTLTDSGPDIRLDGRLRLDLAAREAIAAFAQDHRLARITAGAETLIAPATPALHFGRVPVTPPPGGFLQASAAGERALAAAVTRHVGKAAAVVDLFAGCGTFTLALARLAPVRAFEGDAGAVAALAAGAAQAGRFGLKPVSAFRRDLFREPLAAAEFSPDEVAVIDPPRDGALAQSRAMADSALGRIVAVSCNPGTFARDAAILREGGFRLGPVQPVDQFAWSAHIELVACFER